jgi:fatty-acyl-CoA synthase
LAIVVTVPDADQLTGEELREHMATKFTKFWLPDRYVMIDEMPKTSVGKFDKKVLRRQYAENQLG